MTTLPIWAVYAVSFGTPVFTFIGVLIAQWITRKRDHELETRSRREETLRNLRWAAELAVHDDERMAGLGVAEHEGLGTRGSANYRGRHDREESEDDG